MNHTYTTKELQVEAFLMSQGNRDELEVFAPYWVLELFNLEKHKPGAMWRGKNNNCLYFKGPRDAGDYGYIRLLTTTDWLVKINDKIIVMDDGIFSMFMAKKGAYGGR